MLIVASRLKAPAFLIALSFGCSQKPDPIAAIPLPIETRAETPEALIEEPAPLPAEVKQVEAQAPLPRRVFKRKPKQEIEAQQLAGREAAEPKRSRSKKKVEVVEEVLALESPEERLDPNDPILSDREFYRTVSGWDGFSECLAKERTRREIGSGAMRLLYKISPTGKVIKVKAITPTGDGADAIIPCVEKKAAKMRFSPLNDQQPVKKIAKFVWVANGTTVDVDREVKNL